MAELWVKTGDLLPRVESTLRDGAGDRVDINGRDVTFLMRPIRAANFPVIELSANNEQAGDSTKGDVSYDWEPGDTDVPGGYFAEWQVDFGGERMTFPNNNYDTIAIVASLGEVSS